MLQSKDACAEETCGSAPREGDDLGQGIRDAVALLESIAEDRTILARVDQAYVKRLLRAAGRVARPGPWEKRQLMRAARRQRKSKTRQTDEETLQNCGIRKKRAEAVFHTPDRLVPPHMPPDTAASDVEVDAIEAEAPRVDKARNCYVCKRSYTELHSFYDALCRPCGDFNYKKRQQSADLTGRTALVTGSRVKIGYQIAIILLRAGCRVIVTTRFPNDAARRYACEADFADWGHRLSVFGLDLRHTPSVEVFARHLIDTEPRLDFIINNACQTVRRPRGFYRHLMAGEQGALHSLPPSAQSLVAADYAVRKSRSVGPVWPDSAAMSQLALAAEDLRGGEGLFPTGMLDADLQQVDRRSINSWRLSLQDVSAVELLEVQLVNAVAPFILNARLEGLMRRVPSRDKHIVNVSAMEGQFYRSFKTAKHPHTNMAKAALNMMTRTSASAYVKNGIHMNSVDTGWVTDEDPVAIAARKQVEHGFHPPLDIVDGAARVCDPIIQGYNTGVHVWGQFLKDYTPTHW